MNFIEIERGVWIAPELVTSVTGRDGSVADPHYGYSLAGGHWVEIQLMGGQVVRCREHMGPTCYAPDERPDCYLLIGPHDGPDCNALDWTREKSLIVAEAHAAEVQAQIALYRTPVNIVPMVGCKCAKGKCCQVHDIHVTPHGGCILR